MNLCGFNEFTLHYSELFVDLENWPATSVIHGAQAPLSPLHRLAGQDVTGFFI